MNKYYSSWDKVRILPQITEVESRKDCNTSQKLFGLNVDIPLIPASMHSLISKDMVKNVEKMNSFVPQPRDIFYETKRPVYSVSLDNAINVADKFDGKCILFLEIANAYQMSRMTLVRKELKHDYPEMMVIGGTVADYEGARMLENAGYDAVLLGIGNGSVCNTTFNTGVGLNSISSLLDISDKGGINIPIILSGGVGNYGDFCKAIALGADLVMSGSLFSRCIDTETKGTKYWGEASYTQKRTVDYIEGKTIKIEPNNKISSEILLEAKQSLQSAMSYSNSFNLSQFRYNVKFCYLQ